MMTSTDIANRALDMIGETSVLSDLETDTSSRGRIIRRVYDDTRKSVLQAYPWNFAAGRASVTAHTESPAFPSGYYYYAYPSDCLIVRSIDDFDPLTEEWRSEVIGTTESALERVIFINRATPLKFVYTRDIQRLDIWSALARDAFAALLGARISFPITQKASVEQKCFAIYDALLDGARVADAQEASSTVMYTGSWLQARW